MCIISNIYIYKSILFWLTPTIIIHLKITKKHKKMHYLLICIIIFLEGTDRNWFHRNCRRSRHRRRRTSPTGCSAEGALRFRSACADSGRRCTRRARSSPARPRRRRSPNCRRTATLPVCKCTVCWATPTTSLLRSPPPRATPLSRSSSSRCSSVFKTFHQNH